MANNATQAENPMWKFEEVLTMENTTLEALAENTEGALAIGIFSIIWLFWIAASMLIPWQNSASTGEWDPPIYYLWTLTGDRAMFNSWLPIGYLMAWVFNICLYLTELFAWMANGDFLIVWMYVGLYAGLVFGYFPVAAEIIYIFSEWPIRQSGSAWSFIFWSGEFFMIFMQGLLQTISFLLHVIYIGPVIRMVRARQAIDLQLTVDDLNCECAVCIAPRDPEDWEAAKQACQAACDKKCTGLKVPIGGRRCPLRRFSSESDFDYKRRCKAAAQLKQAAKDRESNEDFDFGSVEDEAPIEEIEDAGEEIDTVSEDLVDTGKDLIEDVSSPEDEW